MHPTVKKNKYKLSKSALPLPIPPMEKKSSFFPFPSWQANLPIHDDVSTMALYSSWGWWENPVNKQKPFPLTAKSSSTGSRTSQSSCSPVPYPPSSASDLRIFANISVCCFYKELEFSDFDITPYNIMYFLILFWMIIWWSLFTCSLSSYAEDNLP